jgi:hypothetical protein
LAGQGIDDAVLRSIRRFTRDVPYEVIVVDNGSKDDSLEYLRSLKWIRLIERGDSTPEIGCWRWRRRSDFGIREGGESIFAFYTPMYFQARRLACGGWLMQLNPIQNTRRREPVNWRRGESTDGAEESIRWKAPEIVV